MIAEDENALICDFAETYHVLDYRALPVHTQAVLACGLRENSRIKMRMLGIHPIPLEVMVARMADDMTLLRYGFTDDAKSGANKPDLFTDILLQKDKDKARTYSTGDAFMEEWERLTKGTNNV